MWRENPEAAATEMAAQRADAAARRVGEARAHRDKVAARLCVVCQQPTHSTARSVCPACRLNAERSKLARPLAGQQPSDRSRITHSLAGSTIGPFRVVGRSDLELARRRATPLWLVRCRACGLEQTRGGNVLRQALAGKRKTRCLGCTFSGFENKQWLSFLISASKKRQRLAKEAGQP